MTFREFISTEWWKTRELYDRLERAVADQEIGKPPNQTVLFYKKLTQDPRRSIMTRIEVANLAVRYGLNPTMV